MFSKWFLFFLTLQTSVLAEAATSLTLQQAQHFAIANQPLLQSQQANIEASRQNAVAQSQLPDPRIKLGIQNVPTGSLSLSEESMTMRTIAIEQMVPGGKKRQLRGELANIEAERGVADLESTMRSVSRNAALAWLDLYAALNAKSLIREQQQEFERQIEALRISFRVGKANQEDVLAARNMLNQMLDREAEIGAQIHRARAELARWIGNDANRDLALSLPLPQNELDELGKLQTKLVTHPEVRALDRSIQSAQTELALAGESKKPDWGVEAMYAKRGSAYGDMVGVQFNFELPAFPGNRQNRTIAAKQLLAEKARLLREDRLRSLNAELAIAYHDSQIASERMKLLNTITLPNLIQRRKAVLISYQVGKTNMANVYDAHHAELEARLQYLAQQVALAKAQAQIEYLIGGEQK